MLSIVKDPSDSQTGCLEGLCICRTSLGLINCNLNTEVPKPDLWGGTCVRFVSVKETLLGLDGRTRKERSRKQC